MSNLVGSRSTQLPARREFLGVAFDAVDQDAVLLWLRRREAGDDFAFIVTPNVDHIVRVAQEPSSVDRAYAKARLCLCDSRVLARLARLCGVRLPVVPGSDLVAALFSSVLVAGDVVSLVGGTTSDGDMLRARFPDLVIRQHVPPMGLRDDADARSRATAAAIAHGARFILLAVGSPQQELIALQLCDREEARGTALCIGASVAFIVGSQRRAPRVVQRGGMEWAWRLASDPRRLWRRYLIDGLKVFRLAWQWRQHRSSFPAGAYDRDGQTH